MLAIPARLRTLVTEDRAKDVELDRLRQHAHPVFDVGAQHAGGELGPQGDIVVALVLEGIHLLVDDVGTLPDAAGKELRLLEHRHVDALEPGQLRQVPRPVAHVVPIRLILRQNIQRSGRSLKTGHRPLLVIDGAIIA